MEITRVLRETPRLDNLELTLSHDVPPETRASILRAIQGTIASKLKSLGLGIGTVDVQTAKDFFLSCSSLNTLRLSRCADDSLMTAVIDSLANITAITCDFTNNNSRDDGHLFFAGEKLVQLAEKFTSLKELHLINHSLLTSQAFKQLAEFIGHPIKHSQGSATKAAQDRRHQDHENMYRQIGRLSRLRRLSLGNFPFELQLFDDGRAAIENLCHLKALSVTIDEIPRKDLMWLALRLNLETLAIKKDVRYTQMAQEIKDINPKLNLIQDDKLQNQVLIPNVGRNATMELDEELPSEPEEELPSEPEEELPSEPDEEIPSEPEEELPSEPPSDYDDVDVASPSPEYDYPPSPSPEYNYSIPSSPDYDYPIPSSPEYDDPPSPSPEYNDPPSPSSKHDEPSPDPFNSQYSDEDVDMRDRSSDDNLYSDKDTREKSVESDDEISDSDRRTFGGVFGRRTRFDSSDDDNEISDSDNDTSDSDRGTFRSVFRRRFDDSDDDENGDFSGTEDRHLHECDYDS
ncbi:hypothetical protein BGZ94_005250 [Podila epigama]|nr:hypothetical protein BGZ94_005250 [Podila epigama]